MLRVVAFAAPMTLASVVDTDGGQRLPVQSLLALSPSELAAFVPDPAARALIARVGAGEVVLPGAETWKRLAARARPSEPAWVPALAWNARVVEIEAARDTLADPWAPTRTTSHGGQEIGVLGAASREWRAGDVEFTVRAPKDVAGRVESRPAKFVLRSRDRRRMFEHMTGLVESMEIRRGMVSTGAARDASPVASVGIVGVGEAAAYLNAANARAAVVREDGALRRDQWERTELSERNAELLRRWRLYGEPVAAPSWPLRDYGAIAGADDLGESVRAGRRVLLAVGATAVAAVALGAALQSGAVRAWLAGVTDADASDVAGGADSL